MNIYDKNTINYGIYKDSKIYKLNVYRYAQYDIDCTITWYYEYEYLHHIYFIDIHVEQSVMRAKYNKYINYTKNSTNTFFQDDVARKTYLHEILKLFKFQDINYMDQMRVWKFIKKYTSYNAILSIY